MKARLSAAMICGLMALQAVASDWWVPSPISVAITVGQWLMKDREEVFYLRVQAQGRDETDAREQAFRLAVNQAIGTLVVVETELRNGRITRDEIIAHSSGMVHDFAIVQSQRSGNQHMIVIDVWVAKSQIADRILSRSRDAARVEGGRITEQIASYQATRLSGDSVIETVLDDFPARAFVITVGNTKVSVDQSRQASLLIPVTVQWSQPWLNSMAEAAERVSHQPDCTGWLMRSSPLCRSMHKLLVGTRGGYFDDNKMWDIYMTHVSRDPARLRITIRDTAGNAQYHDCWIIHKLDPGQYGHGVFLEWNQGILINERAGYQGDVALDLRNLPTRSLDRVEAEMVRKSQCPR